MIDIEFVNVNSAKSLISSLDQEIVKLVYANDAKSLINKISQLPTKLIERIKLANFSLVKTTEEMFQTGQMRSGRLSDNNLTLIHIAAYYDSTEVFFSLIDFFKMYLHLNEKDVLYLTTSEGFYPLHYALINQSYEIAMYIANCIPEQIYDIEKGVPYFPITLAVIGGMTRFLDFIFKYTIQKPLPKNQIDQAYEMALEIGEYPCIKLLIENKDQEYEKKSNIHETIQMKAALNCSPEVVSLVLRNEHENLQRIFMSNDEPDSLLRRLLLVQPPKFKEQIKYLLSIIEGEKIDPDGSIQCKGVCHWMCYFCDTEISEILYKNFLFDINRKDAQFQTGPFMMKRDDLKEKEIINMLQFLIDHNFELNYKAVDAENKLKQKTVLEYFITSKKRLEVVRFLLKSGANPDAPSFIQGGRFGTIRNFVQKKKDKDFNDLFDEFPQKS